MTEQDEERYMAIMAGFDAAMLVHESRLLVPICHMKPMVGHSAESDADEDEAWFECEHCGHSVGLAEAWAKAKTQVAVESK
ncbi:hypothetical protein GIW05_01285 [Pseudomonas syringae]|nr:hypothetical protein [Pseudomonas syringae]MCF5382156.1 hypothetical protein [Pseudomonas syringae]MCF5423511.1 hypothetical protein [Pseudomonas syringae]MCF5455336.1 hypothetical protein [Pseudomonas syringae]MCF5460835.1 hypothetical protein [Pseudomonas syringae]